MKVTISKLDREGNPVVAGEFTLTNGTITSDKPDDVLMQRILSDPVYSLRTGDPIDPKKHPKEWMEALCYEFHSPYLSASKPF